MATTELDSPGWFDNSYIKNNFEVERDLSDDEIDDIYGFVDGVLSNNAGGPDQVAERLEENNHIDEVSEFADVVDEESLRYSFRGEFGDPNHLGRHEGGNRESRSFSQSKDSEATKDSNPKKSSFTSGRKVNIDRLEKQGELDRSVHYNVREDEEEIKLILDGKVENLYSDRIEIEGNKDLTLDELKNEYGKPFKEAITNLEDGEIEREGLEGLSNISTVVYDDKFAE